MHVGRVLSWQILLLCQVKLGRGYLHPTNIDYRIRKLDFLNETRKPNYLLGAYAFLLLQSIVIVTKYLVGLENITCLPT